MITPLDYGMGIGWEQKGAREWEKAWEWEKKRSVLEVTDNHDLNELGEFKWGWKDLNGFLKIFR